MLETLKEQPNLSVVTKAKLNAKGYYDPEPKTGKGAKPKKGASVKIGDFFETKVFEFIEAKETLYQKETVIKYYSIDLLWGQGLYQKLRFVLTKINGIQSILVSTDLTLNPLQIIKLYSYRFKIECSFRELNQVVAGFCYHFWCKVMPKLNRYKNNEYNCQQSN